MTHSLTTDKQIQLTLNAINEEYFSYFFKQILLNKKENCNFFSDCTLTCNLLELIIEMVKLFSESEHLKYYVIHLVDKFYKHHIQAVIDEFKSLATELEKENNSWIEVVRRLRKQIAFRIITCIFIAIKYKFRRNELKIADFLLVLNKYGYSCKEDKFKKSQLRVLNEIDFSLEFVTLLDYVLFLQSLLKYNMNLATEFYFPYIYNMIDLIYAVELKTKESNSFLIYSCLVLCIVPVLINHKQTKQVIEVK